ncbi:hypothetical protein P9139_21405 [Curtobacterium flaccumfaciens]|nr:hypothetical protein P9139_21405 [Curtobacterium flaccumfaciens]
MVRRRDRPDGVRRLFRTVGRLRPPGRLRRRGLAPVATIGVLGVGICWSVARRLRGRAGWPIAVATLLGVIAVFLAAVTTIQIASGGHLR